ncbi:MAG: SNF2 helicase associated domain-containing protein, partial [bacterium]
MQISDPELRYFSKNVFYKSSRKLCDQGKVRIYNYDEDSVNGEVSDDGVWRIIIWRNRYSNLQSDSDCRCYTNPCQHVVALLIAVLDDVNGRASVPRVQQWEQYLQKLPELPPKIQTATAPKSWKLIFFLRPGALKWTLEARRTYVKKDGQLGQRGRLQLDYYGNLRDITASPAEEKAIACIRKINQNAQTYGYSSYYSRDNLKDLELEYGLDVGYLVNALAGCRLYLGPEEWKSNHQARRLSISAAGARLYFKLEDVPGEQEQSHDYHLAPYIELNDTVLNFDPSVRILSATPLWLLVQDRLICIDTSFPARYLVPFTRKNTADLTIPHEDLGRFLQGFLPHINNRIELVFPENFRFEKVKELTGRRLYLHEKGENLCVTLKPVYGDIEIDGSAAGQISIASDDETNLLWQIERDSEAEAEIHDMLAVSGLEWDELLSCYVPTIDAVDWLFEALPKLAEAGFEIFGEENLKRKVNRAAPSVNVVVSSGIDWLDMNIELDFNGIMLSLASLSKAVKKQSRYVKLADGSLAKIPDAWQKRFKHFFNFVTSQNGTVQVPSTQAMLIDALFEESEKKRYDDSFKKHLQRLKNFKGIEEVQVPENFQGTLRPYQREGLSWL